MKNYVVLEDGTVIGLRGRPLKPWSKPDGYLLVNLRNSDGTKNHHLVHRLVAMKYIPNPENLPQVNHKDGNKSNNSVENLEWCSPSYNMKHSYESGLRPRGVTPSNAKITKEQAEEMRLLRQSTSLTYKELGALFGLSLQAAHCICKGKYFIGA